MLSCMHKAVPVASDIAYVRKYEAFAEASGFRNALVGGAMVEALLDSRN